MYAKCEPYIRKSPTTTPFITNGPTIRLFRKFTKSM